MISSIIYAIVGKAIQGVSLLGGIYLGIEQRNWELGTISGAGGYVLGYFIGELGYKAEDELEKKYDLVKNQFTQDLNLQIQSKLESIEAKEQKEMKKSGVWESLTDKQQAMTSYLSNHSSEEASKHFWNRFKGGILIHYCL